MQHVRLLYKKRRNRNIFVIKNGKEGVIDTLFERFSFLKNTAKKIIKGVRVAIKEQNPVLCGELLKELGKVDDKLLEFGKHILPYITPRLQTLEINKKVEKRYVIRVPTVTKDSDKWLNKVKEEQKQIPKFDVDKAMNTLDDEIEDIEIDEDYELDERRIN